MNIHPSQKNPPTAAHARDTDGEVKSPTRQLFTEFLSSRPAVIGLALAVALTIAAILSPWLSPQNPYDLMQIDVMDARLSPGTHSSDNKMTYWLGSDGQGRDLFSGILYGLRISLGIGIGSAIIAGVIGTILGLLSAFYGGKTDALIMRAVDLTLSLPSILMAMMMLAYLGKGITNVLLTLVFLEWAYYARTARGQAISEHNKEYVEAARCLSIPDWRIMLVHILPNCMPPLIIVGMLQIARAITLEATLSFLGLGVPITEPSLGMLIANGYQNLLSGEYWISVFPGIALIIAIMSLNLIGDRFRDILNPRLQK